MGRSSATTGLIIEAPRVLKETIGVFSEPECGASMRALGAASRRVASYITRAASSRYELVIVSLGLVGDTGSVVTSDGQVYR